MKRKMETMRASEMRREPERRERKKKNNSVKTVTKVISRYEDGFKGVFTVYFNAVKDEVFIEQHINLETLIENLDAKVEKELNYYNYYSHKEDQEDEQEFIFNLADCVRELGKENLFKDPVAPGNIDELLWKDLEIRLTRPDITPEYDNSEMILGEIRENEVTHLVVKHLLDILKENTNGNYFSYVRIERTEDKIYNVHHYLYCEDALIDSINLIGAEGDLEACLYENELNLIKSIIQYMFSLNIPFRQNWSKHLSSENKFILNTLLKQVEENEKI